MSEAAFCSLQKWHRQALNYEITRLAADYPDSELLFVDWHDWPRGLLAKPVVLPSGRIRLTLKKPKEPSEVTTRDVPPAWLFISRVHSILGGRIAIEPHGKGGPVYYPRQYVGPSKPVRRFYIMREIAGTAPGLVTREPQPFKILDYTSIEEARGRPKAGRHAKIGRPEVVQYTIDALRELGKVIPAGVDEALVRRWLEDGYRLLETWPPSPAAQAAE